MTIGRDLQVRSASYFLNWSLIVSARGQLDIVFYACWTAGTHSSRREGTQSPPKHCQLDHAFADAVSVGLTLVLVWKTAWRPLGVMMTPDPLLLGLLLPLMLPRVSVVVKLFFRS